MLLLQEFVVEKGHENTYKEMEAFVRAVAKLGVPSLLRHTLKTATGPLAQRTFDDLYQSYIWSPSCAHEHNGCILKPLFRRI